MTAQNKTTKKRASIIPNLDEIKPEPQVTPEPQTTQITAPSTATTPATTDATTSVENLDAQTQPETKQPDTPEPTQEAKPSATTSTQTPTTPPQASAQTTTQVASDIKTSNQPIQPPQTTTPKATPQITYGEIPLEKKNTKLYHIGIGLLILILGLTGIILYLRSNSQKEVSSDDVEVIATPIPTTEATPEPTPEISQLERSEITLEILNGTGVAGLAGSTSDKFEELGYTIESVGNAESTDSNQLIVSSEYEDMIEVLLEDVLEELNISEITQTSDELEFTARIIIGVAP